MSASTAIAAVYDRLKTVTGVGPNVYDQIRFSNDDAQFRALFMDALTDPDAPIIRAWMVSREASSAKDAEMQAMIRTHKIVMTGYMAFQDNVSEPLFQAQIEAICAAFLPYTARHFDNQFDWSGPPEVEGVKLVFFGSVLCHAVRIIHPVQEFPLN
jgi:hypothetical protein